MVQYSSCFGGFFKTKGCYKLISLFSFSTQVEKLFYFLNNSNNGIVLISLIDTSIKTELFERFNNIQKNIIYIDFSIEAMLNNYISIILNKSKTEKQNIVIYYNITQISNEKEVINFLNYGRDTFAEFNGISLFLIPPYVYFDLQIKAPGFWSYASIRECLLNETPSVLYCALSAEKFDTGTKDFRTVYKVKPTWASDDIREKYYLAIKKSTSISKNTASISAAIEAEYQSLDRSLCKLDFGSLASISSDSHPDISIQAKSSANRIFSDIATRLIYDEKYDVALAIYDYIACRRLDLYTITVDDKTSSQRMVNYNDSLISSACTYFYKGDYTAAFLRYRSLYNKNMKTNIPKWQLVDILNDLAICAKKADRPNPEQYLLEGLKIVDPQDDLSKSMILYNLSIMELDTQKYIDAKKHISQAIDIQHNITSDCLGLARSKTVLSAILLNEGRLTEAFEEGHEALSLKRSLLSENHHFIMESHYENALIYFSSAIFDKAKTCILKAEKIARKIKAGKRILAAIYKLDGLISYNIDNKKVAINLFKSELKQYKGMSNANPKWIKDCQTRISFLRESK